MFVFLTVPDLERDC